MLGHLAKSYGLFLNRQSTSRRAVSFARACAARWWSRSVRQWRTTPSATPTANPSLAAIFSASFCSNAAKISLSTFGGSAPMVAVNATSASASDVLHDEMHQKAHHQIPGLVQLIGELFKLQMLTEHIMHECVDMLLRNIDDPDEEDIESLCALLESVGQNLDTTTISSSKMDPFYGLMKDLIDEIKLDSCLRTMLLEVIALRSRNWIPRDIVVAPRIIQPILSASNVVLTRGLGPRYRAGLGWPVMWT